jgi:hypothetical protein
MTQLFLACRVKEQMAQIHDVHAGLLGHAAAKHPRTQRKAIIYARAVHNGHLEKSTKSVKSKLKFEKKTPNAKRDKILIPFIEKIIILRIKFNLLFNKFCLIKENGLPLIFTWELPPALIWTFTATKQDFFHISSPKFDDLWSHSAPFNAFHSSLHLDKHVNFELCN